MPTGFSVFGSNVEAKQWSEATILEMAKQSNFERFIGEGPNNIIQRRTDLNKDKGAEIEFDLLKKLQNNPTFNEQELVGQEEKMEFVTDTVKIAEMAHAVKKYGKFEDIKSKKDLLTLAKNNLSLWMQENYDSLIAKLLTGCTEIDWGDGAFKATKPSSNRVLYGGDWADGDAIDSGDDWMRVRDISRYKQYAKMTCGIRPVNVDGTPTYVVFLHPYQWGLIRAKDPDYKNALLYAEQKGRENPLFTGMIGYWDGCAIFENDFLPAARTQSSPGTAISNSKRGAFCGQQALIMSWGAGPYPGEQDYDFGRKKGISLSLLWGLKKSILGPDNFQSPSTYTDDYGVIALDSYAVALTGTASDTSL